MKKMVFWQWNPQTCMFQMKKMVFWQRNPSGIWLEFWVVCCNNSTYPNQLKNHPALANLYVPNEENGVLTMKSERNLAGIRCWLCSCEGVPSEMSIASWFRVQNKLQWTLLIVSGGSGTRGGSLSRRMRTRGGSPSSGWGWEEDRWAGSRGQEEDRGREEDCQAGGQGQEEDRREGGQGQEEDRG